MISKLLHNRVRRTYLGGSRIDAFTGYAPPADGNLRPEDWLASTTTAFNGTLEIPGEGLGRLEDGSLVVEAVGALPVLVKLLDAEERLVIQAHPTVEYAKAKFHSPVGKTECWYFLPGTAPDACVYLGFQPGITKERWRDAFHAQAGMLECLHRVPVKCGDFIFVDGGVPHAIGAGCFMIELQEPSDLMVVAERFTPSGRAIAEKKLHGGLGWEEMFNVYDYTGYTLEELLAKYSRHIDPASSSVPILGRELTDKFQMWRLSQGLPFPLGRHSAVAVAVSGHGSLNGKDIAQGDCLLIASEEALSITGNLTIVLCFK